MARPIPVSIALILLGLSGLLVTPGPTAGPGERASSSSFGIPVEGEPSTPGALVVEGPEGQLVEMPLRHTRVSVEISAFVARTVIEQVFANPFEEPVEAVYTFPLGERAAVDDFELIVGDRVIRGEIRRRDEARRRYEAARAAGHRAALLEQERPNIFTQSVANIEPGGEVTVRIRTVETLRYEAGVYAFTFPLVVGPRYIPGDLPPEPDPPFVPPTRENDAGRITPPVLRPGFRSGHDVEIAVTLDAGVPLGHPVSPSHRILVERAGENAARLRLAPDDSIPNKDFMLRWSVASEKPALGLLTHREDSDGFFSLLVQPRDAVGPEEAAPKEIVFVLDTSGSMSGIPMEASKRFVEQALRTLGPRDTFNLIRFAGAAESFSPEPLFNEGKSIDRALEWVKELRGGGGTEMLAGFRAAFARERNPDRMRLVIFLTDGYIGNEDQIFSAIGEVVGEARIFSLGVGSSVNHYLLRGMAEIGRGGYVFIRPDEQASEAVDRFRSWVTRPYLTDLEIDWGALPVTDLVPERLPDLYSGQTLNLVGRYLGAARGEIVLRGKLGGRYWEQRMKIDLPESSGSHAALASVWARQRITELLQETPGRTPPSTVAEVTALALEYRLMSPFTSFVAVDEAEVVNPGGESRQVHQALPMPEGVSFEGVFGAEGPPCLGPRPEPGEEIRFEENEMPTTTFEDEFVESLQIISRNQQGELAKAPSAKDEDREGSSEVRGARERDFKATIDGVSNVDPLTISYITDVSHTAPRPARGVQVAASGHGAGLVTSSRSFVSVTPDPKSPARRSPVISHSDASSGERRLRERALRVLADLAEDGELSGAEGRPALAALLGALTPGGGLSREVTLQALGTWALAEAAAASPEDSWLSEAAERAAEFLMELALETGWPEHWGGPVDAEATRWARLALEAAGISDLPATGAPRGAGSAAWAGLRRALASARSGSPAEPVEGQDPFARLLRAIPRGHLTLCDRGGEG